MSWSGVVELFAGPGGMSTGLRLAGYEGRVIGLEWDMDACRTATAAGHDRIRADVAAWPVERFAGAEGVCGSPPCQAWSAAGKRLGLVDQHRIHDHLSRVTATGHWVDYPRTGWADDRSPLILEPVRWVSVLRPEWFMFEQVPDVLPFWRRIAAWARTLGYSTWATVLSSEEFGVPQTRRRAFVAGRLHGPTAPPVPTHQAYRRGEPAREVHDLFGGVLLPWVSMAEALGWDLSDRPSWTVTGGGTDTGGAEVFGNAACRARLKMASAGRTGLAPDRGPDEPSATITGTGNLSWVYRNGNQAHSAERAATQPAPTVHFSERSNDVRWVFERPATTVCGDARIGRPGHKDRDRGESQFDTGSIRVTVEEAATLQGMPDYPWYGTQSSRFAQVGNVVCPPVAAAVLRDLIAPR